MPYIITTTTPDPANAKDYGRFGDPVPNAPTAMGAVRGCWPPRVSRTAVATLDEARAKAQDAQGEQVMPESLQAAWSLPESGGTVGPLPDGTVIEVRPVEWDRLAETSFEQFDGHAREWKSRAIEAFNAS